MLNSSEMKRTKEHVRRCREHQRSLRKQIDELDHLMDDDFFKNHMRCWAMLLKEQQEQYLQYAVPAVHSRKPFLQEGGLEPGHEVLTGAVWGLIHRDRHSRNNRARAAPPVVKVQREPPAKRSEPLSDFMPRPSPFNQKCNCGNALEKEDFGSVLEVDPHPKKSFRKKKIAI